MYLNQALINYQKNQSLGNLIRLIKSKPEVKFSPQRYHVPYVRQSLNKEEFNQYRKASNEYMVKYSLAPIDISAENEQEIAKLFITKYFNYEKSGHNHSKDRQRR